MPQDIPLEASETLHFTPPSLAETDGAPVFNLRAATTRQKRALRRLYIEEALRSHEPDALRAEVLTGLRALWDEQAYAEHSPRITAFWEARDQHVALLKEDPELVWSFDPEQERAINDLTQKVADAWPPLRRMLADNADLAEMSLVLVVAVVLKSWIGLKTPRQLESNHLTVDCAEQLRDELIALDKRHGNDPGLAWSALAAACTRRMGLMEEEAGNSASPSASPTPPASPTATTPAPGPSPESESSAQTLENA